MKKIQILGGISYQEFLRDYWQKKPLLIRQAFPKFQSLIEKNDLFSLSYQDDIQSRIITHKKNKWELFDGPFDKSTFKKLTGIWTLLVQGVNYVRPSVQVLLNQFNFIPYSRLDDVMISYATPGGGVGPHVDSYDVFLLQGYGKRLWRISDQKDQTLAANMPLKILKKFKYTQEWVLEPGDMLYLPPNYAHHGVALDECMTYSIGFRAPTYQELSTEFLGFLQEHNCIDGIYKDPNLTYTKQPAQLSNEMIQKVSDIIHKIQFDKKDIATFLGKYLTQPKAQIIFDSPSNMVTKNQFLKHIKKNGIALHAKTQMLYLSNTIFMNGDCFYSKEKILKELANKREIKIIDALTPEVNDLFYQWYLEGYIA